LVLAVTLFNFTKLLCGAGH